MRTKVQFYDLDLDPHNDPRTFLEKQIKDELAAATTGWHVAAAFPMPGQPANGRVIAVIYHK